MPKYYAMWKNMKRTWLHPTEGEDGALGHNEDWEWNAQTQYENFDKALEFLKANGYVYQIVISKSASTWAKENPGNVIDWSQR